MTTEKELTGYPSIDKPWLKYHIKKSVDFDVNATLYNNFKRVANQSLNELAIINYRTCKKATFSDVSRDATDVVIKNAKKAKLFDKCRVSTCDYKQMIQGIANKEKYDIIFIDPPYQDKIILDVLKRLFDADVINENAFIVCESGKEDIFECDEELKNKFFIHKQSKYSISYITVLRPNGEEQ